MTPQSVLLTCIGCIFLVPAAMAQANSTHLDATVPFSSVLSSSCGEDVALTGMLHISMSTVETPSGNERFAVHSQVSGISGIGMTTGDDYHGSSTSSFVSHDNGGSSNELTSIENMRLIGRGRKRNFKVHILFHITVNANGDITAFHSEATTTCK